MRAAQAGLAVERLEPVFSELDLDRFGGGLLASALRVVSAQ
jgi:hypothetical protein